MNRRTILKTVTAGAAGLTASIPSVLSAATKTPAKEEKYYKAKNGKIRQSVMGWCFKPMPVPELIDHCVKLGLDAIEGISPEFYPLAVKKGLKISLVKSHNFNQGPTDPQYHAEVEQKILKAIDTAKQFGAGNVMVFSGYEVKGLSAEQMATNCLNVWGKVIGHAEKQGITLCLEQLSTRDTSHPMKGHPGYFANDFDQTLDMVKQVGSDNFKLLYDVYHVSVMNGDVIRRMQRHIKHIGHVHTAGNPGRGELDLAQEIHYPSVMQALLETGYKGFVAHEFIPTREDKVASLSKAVQLCDIPL